MKLLELYCGTKSISKAFEKLGWETYTVDWDERHNPTLKADISKLTHDDMLELCKGKPDVIWASPDCTTYSIASTSYHRQQLGGITMPKTKYAKFCDNANVHLAKELEYFAKLGSIIFIENPRGMMRKMGFWAYPRYTVTYCQYGDYRQKPTDIWTNLPNPRFKPPCARLSPCHVYSPRGSTNGTQGLDKIESAKIPEQLATYISYICDDWFKGGKHD